MFLTPENSAHSVVKKKYRERVKRKKKKPTWLSLPGEWNAIADYYS